MNLVEATLDGSSLSFAGFTIPLPPGWRPQVTNGRVIVGIRPETFVDAALGDSSLPKLDVDVEVVEELGAETHVIFPVDAAPVDVSGAREAEATETLLADARTVFTARLDPQTAAHPGRPLCLAVDPARFHYFDPGTGDRLAQSGTPVLARV